MKKELWIDGNSLSSCTVANVVNRNDLKVKISPEVEERILQSYNLLQKFVRDNRIIYGVNTGMGGFVDYLVPPKYAKELQDNLLKGVATNVGEYLDQQYVRAAMLVRLNSLSRGHSGISPQNFKVLLDVYNSGIVPCVPKKGSLGASGDLGPLAYIALVANGQWRAFYNNRIVSGKEALELANIQPMNLSYKEGLSLINGTSMMAGMGALLIEKAINLIKLYDVISCFTFESLRARKKPFDPVVHEKKPHIGQLTTAKNIWKLLNDSKIIVDEAALEEELRTKLDKVVKNALVPLEDAYSIRCTPHIIGPIRDALKSVQIIVNNEINSSNDNPLILTDVNEVFHNGHFHGQYIAFGMDQVAICLTTLSNLSDRRIDRYMKKSHNNGLPAFLCSKDPGLKFGLMGGQFMATSLTAENRSLCIPLSIQTLTSTGDFQDIVSLGLIAVRRAEEIYKNTLYIVAFELLCAMQAATILGLENFSKASRTIFEYIHPKLPSESLEEEITDNIEMISSILNSEDFLIKTETVLGKIQL